MTHSALAATLMARVDSQFDLEVAFLSALVQKPSDNPPGDCADHAEMAAKWLEQMGFKVERHAVPANDVHRNGMISATNLVIRHRFGAGPVIALNAHGDVVPPGDGWTAEPYGAEIRDGFMYGRGAAVSKSDFATYAFALKALIDSGAALAGTIELHLTYDEETGGLIGPGWLLKQGIVKPDYAICAGFSYAITTAHNGAIHLEVTVRGKSAHAARPDTGHDALEAATAVLNALYAHRAQLRDIRSNTPGIEHPTLVVGLIKGGINTNVVPDKVTLRLDRRVVPEENTQDVLRELKSVILASAKICRGSTWISRKCSSLLRCVHSMAPSTCRKLCNARPALHCSATFQPKAFPFTPMPACIARQACRPLFTARGRARFSRQMDIARMNGWRSTT
ncbi:Acetylornithine deacetylase [Caballeronia sordidicola]|uniref:Acetylornithine deacetylase n=1 Tax=Caballeronia sordidicola TaxID=196367 RepID=A0A242N013_CABSO|nr:Acetylornithine deacetylase [Caballeronia sordidicola]